MYERRGSCLQIVNTNIKISNNKTRTNNTFSTKNTTRQSRGKKETNNTYTFIYVITYEQKEQRTKYTQAKTTNKQSCKMKVQTARLK